MKKKIIKKRLVKKLTKTKHTPRKLVGRRVPVRVVRKLFVQRAPVLERKVKLSFISPLVGSTHSTDSGQVYSPQANFAFMEAVRQVSLKLLVFMLAIGLNGLALSRVGHTAGYYNDEESSAGNVFDAGMLDIVLSNTVFEGVISNNSGDQSQFGTNVSLVDGSLPTQYDVEYEATGGDASMCNVLTLGATHDTLLYSGALASFSVSTTTDFGLWSFAVSVLSGQSVTSGETCEFDLIYKAWIDGAPSFETSGFNDEERFHIVINAAEVESPVVINEFLPNPDGVLCTDGSDDCEEGDPEFIFDFGRDSDDKPQGEWVELYNLTGSPINLTGWYVQDASGGEGNTQVTNANTLPATTTIPANGYLVIYMNKPVWNNTGDTVKLFSASNLLQDSYAYTSDYDYCYLTPTPGETNDEDPSEDDIDCTPGATIPGNKSYARIPDGTGSFVDPVPTPGVRNSLDEANAPEEVELVTLEMEVATSTEVIFEVATSTEIVLEEATSTEPIIEETASSTEAVLEEEEVITEEEVVTEEEIVSEEETVPEETVLEAVSEEPALPPELIEPDGSSEPERPEPVVVEEAPAEPTSSE
ncbi:MAG: lamin tail domain-containing protein [bacterium]|nr:lamin tail domain-containing protein [bacterium]